MMFNIIRSLWKSKGSRPVVTLDSRNLSKGCVSISYLTWPFVSGLNQEKMRGHTNAYEVLQMAESFLEQGFRVEVCDWNNDEYTLPSDCRIAIDIHSNLERWNYPEGCIKILHATGPHWLHSNKGELDRIAAVRDRQKVVLAPRRQVAPSRAIEIADQATVLGNQYTIDTFRFSGKRFTRIPISSAYELPWPNDRDISQARRKFLWVGSLGMVHKGLDLVLEAFAKMPEFDLTVCGRPEKEADFFSLYKKLLTDAPNIKLHGWLDMGGEEFLDISRTHAAVVYPSSSEGGAGSVIHCMHAGMLPICTRETSVDLEDFGIGILSGDLDGVIDAVRVFAEMSNQEIEARTRKAYDHVRNVHTREAFAKNYRKYARDLTGKLHDTV